MAWSSPSTRSTGYLVTAATWNQDVVNNPIDLDARNEALAANDILNPVINGNFVVWQRGTSFSPIGSGNYSADRWFHEEAGSMVMAVAQSSIVPSASTFTGEGRSYTTLPYSMLISPTTADTVVNVSNYILVAQAIEGYEWVRMLGKAVTVSFWVRGNVTGTYGIALRNSAKDYHCILEFTIDASNTWEWKSVTFPATTTGTWSLGTGIGAILSFCLMGGSDYQNTAGSWGSGNDFTTSNQVNFASSTSNEFRLAGVQMNAGSVALEYGHPSYAQELRRCLRYYWRVRNADSYVGGSDGNAAFAFGQTWSGDATKHDILVYSPVGMRTGTPTIGGQLRDMVGSATTTTSIVVASGIGTGTPQPHLDEDSRTVWLLTATTSGSGTGGGIILFSVDHSGSSDDFTMDAEL